MWRLFRQRTFLYFERGGYHGCGGLGTGVLNVLSKQFSDWFVCKKTPCDSLWVWGPSSRWGYLCHSNWKKHKQRVPLLCAHILIKISKNCKELTVWDNIISCRGTMAEKIHLKNIFILHFTFILTAVQCNVRTVCPFYSTYVSNIISTNLMSP